MVNGRVERKNARRINGDKEEPEKPRIGVKKEKSQENTRQRYLYSNGALSFSDAYSHAKRFRLIKLLDNKRIKEKKKKNCGKREQLYVYESIFFVRFAASCLCIFFVLAFFPPSLRFAVPLFPAKLEKIHGS